MSMYVGLHPDEELTWFLGTENSVAALASLAGPELEFVTRSLSS